MLSNVPSKEWGVCPTSHSHGTRIGVAFSTTPTKSYEARVPFSKAIQIPLPPCPTPFIALRITFQTLKGLRGPAPAYFLTSSTCCLPTPQTHESAFGTSNRIDTSVSPWGLYNPQFPGQTLCPSSTAHGSICSCRS